MRQLVQDDKEQAQARPTRDSKMWNRKKSAQIGGQLALTTTSPLLTVLVLLAASSTAARQQQYYGSLIGKLTGRSHNVSGDVYAVDEQTLFIKAFNYDGLAPDAYFWSSTQASAGPAQLDGFIVPDEKGSTKPLERYTDKDIVLRLPEGKTLREIHWLSVWSRATKQSSGDITIGRQLQTPRPLEIGPLSQLAHGLRSGPITIVDAQTFLLPDFHYDGLGPEAYFWLTRGSSGLGPSGLKLKDENGASGPLRKYAGETVVISLPDELTIHDFDFFGVWCTKFQANFGQVRIPQAARVPPSPKMLGIKPENKLNCEILYDDLGYEIRWVLDGDDIVMQLVGKIEPGEYMAFGLGKDDSRSDMQNADAVVAWVDRQSGQVHAVDYFLGGKAQCAHDPRGSCPDSKLAGGGDSLTLLHGAIVNGYSMVTFKRPQLGVDDQYDQHVYSDGQQSVLWAIGALNSQHEIGYHRLKTRANMFIDFARNPQWNCPIPDLNASMHSNLPVASASQLDQTVVSAAPEQSAALARQPQQQQVDKAAEWFIPTLACPPERTFYAQLGPTGGRKGYEARTGRTGWGLAWYVNGVMIPELVLERGLTYRFVVEGGSDKTSAARRHPFYLTDSADGGFDFKTDDERVRERIFAGVALRGDGQFVPTAEGRLCEWRPSSELSLTDPDSYATFAAYQRSLKLDCAPGQAAVLKFTPDASTPDQIYYQCYTHRFMGWRVRVVDSCSAYLKAQESSGQNNTKQSDTYERRYSLVELESGESRVASSRTPTRVAKRRAQQRQGQLDFGDEPAASSSLSSFPSDMLILNTSLLNQRQPFNMSTIEQILRLSPSDLEFIGSQTEEPLATLSTPLPLHPLTWPNLSAAALSLEPAAQSTNRVNKTSGGNQQMKTWNSYLRRLASIYYPVQQQLASILSSGPQSSAVNQQSAQIQAAPSEQTASFSLSNLVPKPKIDLSKSGLTKKLNKLRFKSGSSNQKQEKLSQPPTPAIEFNYDIFNNQLAQLEKQQKQLQTMEMLGSWPQPQHQPAVAEQINYMPMMQSSSDEQQTIGSLEPQLLLANQLGQTFANMHQQLQPPRFQDHGHHQTIRLQVPAHGSGNHAFRHPHEPQRLSFPQPVRQAAKIEPPWPSEMQQQPQQSVYITRLPNLAAFIPQQNQHAQFQMQPSGPPVAARYPNIQPYNGLAQQQQQHSTPAQQRAPSSEPLGGQYPSQQHMSIMPSVALSVHDTAAIRELELESLSGSGSGAQYEFRPQPALKSTSGAQASRNAEADHMMAIERFSNARQQTNEPQQERWPQVSAPARGSQREYFPYGAHAANNELAASASQHLSQQMASTSTNSSGSSNSKQPRRYSNILIDKHILASGDHFVPPTSNLIEVDQAQLQTTTTMETSNSHRNNSSDAPVKPMSSTSMPMVVVGTTTTISSGGDINARPPTTEQPTVLVQPTAMSLAHELFGTTAPSVGPLVPSFGPPSVDQFARPPLGGGEPILSSTLVDPISSTLIQNPSPAVVQAPSQFHIDSSPFTPVQLRPNPLHHHLTPLHPISPRFNPLRLVESILGQQQLQATTFRPEPPVQVASYLSQHLTNSRNIDGSSVSNDGQPQGGNRSSAATSDLIILKPAVLAKQNPQTYLLRPEHYTTSLKSSIGPDSASDAASESEKQRPGELGGPTRRIAGRQFDRLSSLSSPPSTSIALDPTQSISSKSSRQTSSSDAKQQQPLSAQANQHQQQPKQQPNENDEIQLLIEAISSTAQQQHQAKVPGSSTNRAEVSGTPPPVQHRQTSIPSKPIPLSFEPPERISNSLDDDFVRTNPGGENTNTLYRDNNTDHAILSHVMSLISSNAIPTPPLIPVASADYFLPISERNQRSIRG